MPKTSLGVNVLYVWEWVSAQVVRERRYDEWLSQQYNVEKDLWCELSMVEKVGKEGEGSHLDWPSKIVSVLSTELLMLKRKMTMDDIKEVCKDPSFWRSVLFDYV